METEVKHKIEGLKKCLKENGFTDAEIAGYIASHKGRLPVIRNGKVRIVARLPKTVEQTPTSKVKTAPKRRSHF